MAARASRRDRATDIPPDVYVAIARDPEGFDRKLDEWEKRRAAAVEAEATAVASAANAKAEQDTLAQDRAEFNRRQTEARANLAADRDEFHALAKAENTRLVTLDSELADTARRQDAERARLDELAGTIATNLRESEAARASAQQALDIATAARNAALNNERTSAAKLDKLRQLGVELQA
jgi:hypothetical protein